MAEIVDFETFARNLVNKGYKDLQTHALIDLYTAAKAWEPVVTEKVHAFLRSGESVRAIKQYRDDNIKPDGRSAVSLKEAVEVINELIRNNPDYKEAVGRKRDN